MVTTRKGEKEMKRELSGSGGYVALLRTLKGWTLPLLTSVLILYACVFLLPASVQAQADLAVIDFFAYEDATPGCEVLLDFTIQNVGPDPTVITGILNYVFIWDVNYDLPEYQLSPTAVHTVHTYRSLGSGETDHLGPFSVTFPSDTPLDTVLTIVVVTDYANLEPEPDELNNYGYLPIAIVPRPIEFSTTETVLIDEIEIRGFYDVYQFGGYAGDVVYAEILAQPLGSALNPLMFLHGPHPDSMLTSDLNIELLGTDSRIAYLPGLPEDNIYRLEVSYDDTINSTGMYELHLQKAMLEAEPNDDMYSAMPLCYNDLITGTIGYPGDRDYYAFDGSEGDILTFDIDCNEPFESLPDSIIDPVVTLYDAAGDTVFWDDDTYELDPHPFLILPEAGTYYFRIEDSPGDGQGTGYPEYQYIFKLSQLIGVPKPDLEPMNLSLWTESVPAGNWAQVNLETWNIGGLETFTGAIMVDVVLSEDDIIDPSDTLLEVGGPDMNVPADSFISTQITFEIPSYIEPGTYYVGVIVDPYDLETEEDEMNNTAMIQLDIKDSTTSVPDHLPERFALMQNYPNPASGTTTISYHLPPASSGRPVSRHVKIEIFDVAGRKVATVLNETKKSGSYNVEWNGMSDKGNLLTSGVYFCRIQAGPFSQTRRMVLLR
jgi:hypothetical protein